MPRQQLPADLFSTIRLNAMPTVKISGHLFRYFPQLDNREITTPAGSVAEVLDAVNELVPGFSNYIVDEHGALRRHVLVSVNDMLVVDRKKLSDRVPDDGTLYIFQALTGG